jgi:transaldolase
MARSRLHELSERRVSVWMDSLSREMLDSGQLKRLMDDDAVVGVTSNPTIFQKALSTGDWYDDELRELLVGNEDAKEIFIALAVEDVQRACDLMRSAWKRSDGIDGRVSIEVDPDLAYDRDASFDEAIRLH